MHTIYPIDAEGNIKIQPIGYANSPFQEPQTGGFTDSVSEINLSDDCADCLDGLDDFSHIIVLYWLDKIDAYSKRRTPQEHPEVPDLGVLATR
jgi:tRNA (Thr-GGU) A37 N-methylase